jgi:hypothetical protein
VICVLASVALAVGICRGGSILCSLGEHKWRVCPDDSWHKECVRCGERENTYDY